jgi:hypothetical protein
MVAFLSELNDLELWATDIGNAYLEATTSERLISLIRITDFWIKVAQKILCMSLRMGFKPCKAEPDIWMRRVDNLYEYIAVYVDDLAIASKNPQAIVETLTTKYKFKLKGTGEILYHLGMSFSRNGRGELCISPQRYIEKMVDTNK